MSTLILRFKRVIKLFTNKNKQVRYDIHFFVNINVQCNYSFDFAFKNLFFDDCSKNMIKKCNVSNNQSWGMRFIKVYLDNKTCVFRSRN